MVNSILQHFFTGDKSSAGHFSASWKFFPSGNSPHWNFKYIAERSEASRLDRNVDIMLRDLEIFAESAIQSFQFLDELQRLVLKERDGTSEVIFCATNSSFFMVLSMSINS